MANIDVVTLALAKKYTDNQVILGSEISPSIRNGIWYIGDINTGVRAEGLTPYIGDNENWWIGENDTGIRAEAKDTVYIGEGEMPDGYDLQIDPTGNVLQIDEEPQENSENLITSGAVYAAVQEVKQSGGAQEIYTGEGEPPESAVFQIDPNGEIVKYAPIDKTEEMTSPVGVDENGQLWTKAGTSGGAATALTHFKEWDMQLEEGKTYKITFDEGKYNKSAKIDIYHCGNQETVYLGGTASTTVLHAINAYLQGVQGGVMNTGTQSCDVFMVGDLYDAEQCIYITVKTSAYGGKVFAKVTSPDNLTIDESTTDLSTKTPVTPVCSFTTI